MPVSELVILKLICRANEGSVLDGELVGALGVHERGLEVHPGRGALLAGKVTDKARLESHAALTALGLLVHWLQIINEVDSFLFKLVNLTSFAVAATL